MDLLCTETVSSSVSSGDSPQEPTGHNTKRSNYYKERPIRKALPDPALLEDRVLENLLKAEEHHGILPPYFGTVQKEITPEMRRIVADWMLEVCAEQSCQEDVFLLALNYMDRFLSTCRISKNQFQLLGSACLLLASKLREPSSKALPTYTLAYYTDGSITVSDLCQWELFVLSKLKWDMAVVTPHDFLSLLVTRLQLKDIVKSDMVIRHAQTFIALAAKDYNFSIYSSSTVAAASIAAALQGLEWGKKAGVSLAQLLDILHNITRVETDYLCTCLGQIEYMVKKAIAETDCDPNGREEAGDERQQTWNQLHSTPEKSFIKAGTPTDIRDVYF